MSDKSEMMKLQNVSDIRGVALPGVPGEDVNLDTERASLIGRAFVRFLEERAGKTAQSLRLTIGRDPRLSGEKLARAFCSGVREEGANIIDCGLATTPAMFMTTVFPEFKADGAVMVTASHLPYNRNGLKFFTVSGGAEKADITEILKTAEALDAGELPKEKMCPGTCDDTLKMDPEAAVEAARVEDRAAGSAFAEGAGEPDLMDVYAKHLRDIILKGTESLGTDQPLKGLKIAVDAGNGSAGFYASKVLEPLGADTSASRYLDPDGSFPNHIPNPENKVAMASIRDAAVSGGCDLGLIFDTDVDRSAAVDEKGREISRNGIVAMAAALIAPDHPGTTVVTDSVTSDQLQDFLENRLGLHHFRYQRGYRNVINKGQELNAAGTDCMLAIETSGHAAYRDNYFLDDGAFLATRIVVKTALLKAEDQAISSVIADLQDPAEAAEFRFPIHADDFQTAGDAVLAGVEEWAEGQETGAPFANAGIHFSVVRPNYEGVRVKFTGDVSGWFLIRKSLHDPIMPLNVECNEEGGLEKLKAILKDLLSGYDCLDISVLEV
ncbi:MAG: phosphomannomutase/phosphoglucomutase [Eubacteriales bacterium]|nr:phosphomannomutase/phosphoglucomutase [Eubacteriales bacterium]